jgi:hypothetical protein
MVKLATLWERTSAKGRKYFSGFMGDVQVLMFEAGDVTRPNGEVVRNWKLLVQERDPARRPQNREQRPDPGQVDTGREDRPFDDRIDDL